MQEIRFAKFLEYFSFGTFFMKGAGTMVTARCNFGPMEADVEVAFLAVYMTRWPSG